ncbi:transketolase [Myroides sp. M-43]|uniref:transketolase n=1 Tax=Myroides oncorhynchi TaxID=2893756 RepID=UPI001E39D226|nr:transketolase [Myroides oncorhynchi]MCC9041376.1 transketolase [Myroides oncorhynchi]
MKPNTQQLTELTTQVRRDILRMVHAVSSGHPGGSLGCAEFLVTLYQKLMDRKEGFNMDGTDEDIFFLSNGHISPVFYSVLARSGYFPVSELATFRKINTRLQGHPCTHDNLPGVRMASGSLGQGLSVALGAAQAKKLNKDNHLVYVLMGDGELQEGQNWEAIMYASAKKVDNVIATVDLNGKQIDGSTDDVLNLGSVKAKFEAFDWEVIEIAKGNDIDSIVAGYEEAKAKSGKGKPVCVLLHTEMGNGVDFMMNTHAWHGKAPSDAQLEEAFKQNPESSFGDY